MIGEKLDAKVVGIIVFNNRVIVALETGVYIKGDDDVFRRMMFSPPIIDENGKSINGSDHE